MSTSSVGRWCRWSIQKATTNDGRRASGVGYQESSWHLIVHNEGSGVMITKCGRTVYPMREPKGDSIRDHQPDQDGTVCRQCIGAVHRDHVATHPKEDQDER